MKVSLETRSPLEARGDMLLVGKHAEEARLAASLQGLDSALRGQLSRVLTAEKFDQIDTWYGPVAPSR